MNPYKTDDGLEQILDAVEQIADHTVTSEKRPTKRMDRLERGPRSRVLPHVAITNNTLDLVEVVDFDEKRADLIKIRANLIVARDSQKRIVVGQGGRVIKAIGTRARQDIERLLDNRVHLALWVKIEPRWLTNPKRIKALGYV